MKALLRLNRTNFFLFCLILIFNVTYIVRVKSLQTENILNDRSELYDMDDDIDIDVGLITGGDSVDDLPPQLHQRKPEIRKIIKFHRKLSSDPKLYLSSDELINVADVNVLDHDDSDADDVVDDNDNRGNAENSNKNNSTSSLDSYEIIYVDPLEFIDPTYLNKSQKLSAANGSHLGVIYKWGKWEKWGKCSRVCGGGIQMRKRMCLEERPSGTDMETNEYEPIVNGTRKGCVGIFKRFRICNDKPCDDETENSFRNEQCESYNDAPFRGKYYYWESYYKEDNECELNCKPIGQKYYATLNKTVIDGTPCKRPAVYFTHYYRRRAVCVEGICKVCQKTA